MDANHDEVARAINPDRWLERYGDALYRFALARVRDEHVAEDLVQDTFVSAVKSSGTFDGRSHVKTWLTSILKRRIADYYQQTSRRPQALKDVSMEEMGDDEFANQFADLYHPKMATEMFRSSLEKDEFWQIVRDCIQSLPPHLQEAFVTRLSNDGRKMEELCKEINVNKSNFAVRLYRARLLLRQCFERYWLTENDVS